MRAFADRSAALLSGGQQQRVALARAIAFSPTVLLFDEPLSNLDAKLRAEMRVELRALQRRLGVTSVYVTHDQEEALAISDRVIVMNVGGIEQIGTPEDIYNRPKTRFVADFVGSANLIAGRVDAAAPGPGPVDFEADGGVVAGLGAACAARRRKPRRGPHRLYRHGSPAASGGADNGANRAPGTIRQRLFHGDFIQYIVDWPGGALTVRRPPTEMFEEGAAVTLSFAPNIVSCSKGDATEPISAPFLNPGRQLGASRAILAPSQSGDDGPLKRPPRNAVGGLNAQFPAVRLIRTEGGLHRRLVSPQSNCATISFHVSSATRLDFKIEGNAA